MFSLGPLGSGSSSVRIPSVSASLVRLGVSRTTAPTQTVMGTESVDARAAIPGEPGSFERVAAPIGPVLIGAALSSEMAHRKLPCLFGHAARDGAHTVTEGC